MGEAKRRAAAGVRVIGAGEPGMPEAMGRVLARVNPVVLDCAAAEGWVAVLNSLEALLANYLLMLVGLAETERHMRFALSALPDMAAALHLAARPTGGEA